VITAAKAVEIQALIAGQWKRPSPPFRAIWEISKQVHLENTQPKAPEEEVHAALDSALFKTALHGETVLLRAATVDRLEEEALTAPAEQVLDCRMPFDSAFLFLGRSISWFKEGRGTACCDYMAITPCKSMSADDEYTDGVFVTFFIRMEGSLPGTFSSICCFTLENGCPAGPADGTQGDGVGIPTFIHAVLSMMRSPAATETTERPVTPNARKARKVLTSKGVVRVLELRPRKTAPAEPGAAAGTGKKLDHKVEVRGFWRQQAYGKGRALRRSVWISPHVRGPADGESDNRKKVYKA
jgi:hypothetical protein